MCRIATTAKDANLAIADALLACPVKTQYTIKSQAGKPSRTVALFNHAGRGCHQLLKDEQSSM